MVTPADWVEVRLGEVVDFLDGQRRPVKESDRSGMRGTVPYYGASGIVDYVNDYLFDEDLILFGEDGENILSRNTRLAFKVTGKVWVNNHAHVLRPRSGVHLDYLVEYLEAQDYAKYNSGTAQPKLNKVACAGIPVVLPSLQEQEAIAEALSDADAAIEALDALIAKKRDVKQAAMQQLLTGRTRLPGFSEEWEPARLGGIARVRTGSRNNQEKLPGGRFPFYVRSANVESIDSYSYEGEAILIPGEGGIGDIFHYINGPHEVHQRVYRVSDFAPDICAKFVFFHLRSYFGPHAMRNTVKATVDSLRLPTFLEFELLLPSLSEQEAIAEVLSDMDAEVEALLAERDKMRLVKQGMMQELLSGRVRLV